MAFEVRSYYELLALQKVFLEAKFAEEPEIDELLASPFVGDMWLRVIQELQQVQPEHGLPNAKDGWNTWLREKIKVGCREWDIALKRTKKDFANQAWDLEKKKKYTVEVFRPFILTEEAILTFIDQAESA